MNVVICPWCSEMVEIPVNASIAGSRCRCSKCWSLFYVSCEHPLRVQREAPKAVRVSAEEESS